MFILSVVVIIASFCELSHGECSTVVDHPREGITDGVEINDNVEITCQCDGVQGVWQYFNGSEIDSPSKDSIPYVNLTKNAGYATLIITNFLPWHAGNYTCTTTSGRKRIIELKISQQLFTPPTNVRSERITDSSATIVWSRPSTNSAHLSGYRLTLVWTQQVIFPQQDGQLVPSLLSDNETANVENNDKQNYRHKFNGIPSYSHNCVTVKAVYSYDGMELASEAAPTHCFNSSSSAPSAPTNFHLVQLGHRFVSVSWNSPIFPNGPITFYIIYVNHEHVTISVKDLLSSPYTYKLNGLEENSTYDMSVSAITGMIKEGPKSNSISVTTLGSDSAVLSIAVVLETLQDCHKIMENGRSYKETLIMVLNKISGDIRQHCSCEITIGLTYDTKLRCFPRNDSVIIFETKAYGSNETIILLEHSVQEFLHVTSADEITVNGNTLTLSGNGCSERTTSKTTCIKKFFPIPNDGAASDHDHDNKGIVVGVTMASLVIVLVAILAAVIGMIIFYKKKRSYHCDFTDKSSSSESQVTGISGVFNRRSRVSWFLPAIFSTWRASNQTTTQPTNEKKATEQPVDHSLPLPLLDKDATLKDDEMTESKVITNLLQCIDEEQPAMHGTGECNVLDNKTECKTRLEDDKILEHYVKQPEVRNNGVDSCSIPKTDGDNEVKQTVKQEHTHTKPAPKEDVATSYSIPVDYKWNGYKKTAENKPTPNQKHISPIYIEMDNPMREDMSESDGEDDVYSVPVDSISGDSKDAHKVPTVMKGKQVAKTTTSLPIITNTMRSDCKPQGLVDDTKNLAHSIYSLPVDDISSNGDLEYTSPVNSTMKMNLNPSYKTVEANNDSVNDYVTTSNNHGCSRDDNTPFVAAVASEKKHKPTKPNAYKSKSTSTTPREKDAPLYEEILEISAATLPSGIHHNLLSTMSLNKSKSTAKSQELFSPAHHLDDYTVPNTDEINLQKNRSYGDIPNTIESSDYTYVSNKHTRPDVLEDVCTTHTDC